ncbi:serine hydrolase [Parvularcula lutaonensis]|uniref:Serine hydrolase n=1 Tax=Parvularcula lutaonensis TaxID=491923 RepID=A0ABV7MCH2_9PROT|nr:serine hydrolase [Parvularcula lutaonensis]
MPKNLVRVFSSLMVSALFFLAFANATANAAEQAAPEAIAIDKMVEDAFAQFEVMPGLAVAVYTPQGSYASGFGVTDIETAEAVTEDTAFYIASSTKSMWALALAIQHERGDIDLDQPLSDYAPDAPFRRSIDTDRITPRDLLAMSSGIKNRPFVHRVAYSGEHTPELLWDLIGTTRENSAPEIGYGQFRYTNWNYILLSRLVEHEQQTTWQDILSEEIFGPLGMSRTTPFMSVAEAEGWSVAKPHSTVEPDGAARTYLRKTDATMHSAGGVIMSARDALAWLEIFVEDGTHDGKQVIPQAVIRASRQPLTAADTTFNGYQRDHYGLGWYIGPYRDTGHQLVHHFGSFPGARAHVSYMPDQHIGVAVFANDSGIGDRYVDVLANGIYDRLLALPEAEANYQKGIEDVDAWADDLRVRIAALRSDIASRPSTLSRPLADYAGTYVDKEYGTISVSVEDDRLRMTNGVMTTIAQPGTEAETVRVELIPLQGEIIEFKARGPEISQLKYEGATFRKE